MNRVGCGSGSLCSRTALTLLLQNSALDMGRSQDARLKTTFEQSTRARAGHVG
jgi:hypothetical protein